MMKLRILSLAALGILAACNTASQPGAPKVAAAPPPQPPALGDKVLNLAGPVGSRCVAATPDGDIVVQQAPGTMRLPQKYAKTTINCTGAGGRVTKITIHKFAKANEKVLNIGPTGRTYEAVSG